jgi:hypothetical protein
MTPLLSIYPKAYQSIYKRDNCILIFIAALFTTAEVWNQLRCPKLMDKENMVHTPIYTYMPWNITQS